MKFDHLSAGVLYLLWRRRQSGDGSLIPANALYKELSDELAGSEFRGYLRIPAIKKRLRQLKEMGMVEYGESTKGGPVRGPAPNGYRLSVDPQIMTWPSTAGIVIFLHNHPERRLRREAVIHEAVSRGLTRHRTDEPLGPDEISGLIDWCIRKGYIREEEIGSDPVPHSNPEKGLITTQRVDEEELFLRKISEFNQGLRATKLTPLDSELEERTR